MTDLFVFDTNTLVSALLFANAKPAQALQKAQANGFLVCSDATYAELSEVLLRPKFDKYLSQESRQRFLSDYRNAFSDATLQALQNRGYILEKLTNTLGRMDCVLIRYKVSEPKINSYIAPGSGSEPGTYYLKLGTTNRSRPSHFD